MDDLFLGRRVIVRNNIAYNNTALLELEELFGDPIFHQTLSCPKLMGQHTFSSEVINKLTKFYDSDGCPYIYHPYTREKFYITTAAELPDNILVEDLLLIFSYYKKIKIDDQSLKNIMGYFIKSLLIQQRKLNQTTGLLNSKNEIQDILFKNIAEFLGVSMEIVNILSATNLAKLENVYEYKPSDIDFNKILFMAIRRNNHRLTNLLLLENFNIDVHMKDKKGKTSFFWACYHNQPVIAQKLVDFGADIYVKDKQNNTPFSWCYKRNQKSIIELAQKLFNNIDANSLKNYLNPKLLWNYHHIRHAHKNNNQPKAEEEPWILVVSKSHKRRIRLRYNI